jgi:hypothetical protein
MPNINRMGTVYVPTGNPDTVNDSALYAGGELGVAYDWVDRAYQIVKIDSGATATAGKVLAANDLLYWKDKSTYRVTNNIKDAQGGSYGGRTAVAGVLRNAATAGYYIHMLIRGRDIPIKCSTGLAGEAKGDQVVAHTTTAEVVGVDVATAITVPRIGVASRNSTATMLYTDVDLTNIP